MAKDKADDKMYELLEEVFKERNDRRRIRPFDTDMHRDGTWNYIHAIDATLLIQKAYKIGLKQGQKVKP